MMRYVLFCSFWATCFVSGFGVFSLYSSGTLVAKPENKTGSDGGSGPQDLLGVFPEHIPVSQQKKFLTCLKGFALQKTKKFSEADTIFAKVYQEVLDQPFLLKEELICGRFLNAFFFEDANLMYELLLALEEHFPSSAYVPLCRALLCYKEKHYHLVEDFLELWRKSGYRNSLCLDKNIDELFSEFFLECVEADALSHSGKFVEGRMILHRLLESLAKNSEDINQKVYNRIILMMSKNYFLEMQQTDSIFVIPDYYETIVFYQQKALGAHPSLHEKFISGEAMITHIIHSALLLPEEKVVALRDVLSHCEKTYVAIDYGRVVRPILDNLFSSYPSVEKVCRALFSSHQTALSKVLIQFLEKMLAESMQQAKIEEAKTCLSLLYILEPSVPRSGYLTLSQDSLLQLMLQDDREHSRLKSYLSLWDTIPTCTMDQQHLVTHLIRGAKSIWYQGGHDERVLQVLKGVLESSQLAIETQKQIAIFVQQAYSHALEARAVSKLLLLEEFIQEARLSSVALHDEVIANYLADAEYLYFLGDYKNSCLYSLWLTRVHPASASWLLLGLNLVEEGRYQEAWDCFNYLEPRDKLHAHVQKALGLCKKYI